MNPHPGFSEAVVRGRLLHEQLLAEANAEIAMIDWETPTCEPPLLPLASTSGTTRLRVVADVG